MLQPFRRTILVVTSTAVVAALKWAFPESEHFTAGDAIGIAVLVLVIIGPLALWLNVRDRRKTR